MKATIEQLALHIAHETKIRWYRLDDNSYQISKLTVCDYPFLIFRNNGVPICHSWDKLNQEIEIDGVKFVPMEELEKVNESKWCDAFDGALKYIMDDMLADHFNWDALPTIFTKCFLKWHFPVGLNDGQWISTDDVEGKVY